MKKDRENNKVGSRSSRDTSNPALNGIGLRLGSFDDNMSYLALVAMPFSSFWECMANRLRKLLSSDKLRTTDHLNMIESGNLHKEAFGGAGEGSDLEKANRGHQYFKKGDLARIYGQFDCESYTLVRLSSLGKFKGQEISAKFDELNKEWLLHQVCSVLELQSESWEMVVLKSYLPQLENSLDKIFPGCQVDPDYDPTEPSREEMEHLHNIAQSEVSGNTKSLHDAFSERARTMTKTAWPRAAEYYSWLLEKKEAVLDRDIFEGGNE